MKKMNNKGFAISTMLYGLLIIMVLVMSSIMAIMAFNRTNSKKFVDTTTRELEEGLGFKVSDSNLSIDSVDNEIYRNETYHLTYKFKVNEELNFVDFCDWAHNASRAVLHVGNLEYNLTCKKDLNIESKEGYTYFTIDTNFTTNHTLSGDEVYIEINRYLFDPPATVDVDFNISLKSLKIVEGEANIVIKGVSKDFILYDRDVTIDINFFKPGKILKDGDVNGVIKFIAPGNSYTVSAEGNYTTTLERNKGNYNATIILMKDYWSDKSFNTPDNSYLIKTSLKIKTGPKDNETEIAINDLELSIFKDNRGEISFE